MRLLRLSLLFVLLALPAAGSLAATSELDQREAIVSSVADLFLRERFAELEVMARRYRDQKSRTPSGVWKLSSFYEGIGRATYLYGAKKHPDIVYWDLAGKALKWTKKYPASPTPTIAMAIVNVRHAWAIRGSGPGASLSSEQAGRFNGYLMLAHQTLKSAKKLASVDPAWYATMTTIAMGEQWDRKAFGELIAEAFKREPLYYTTYFNATAYLLPKWFGSIEQLEEFVSEVANKTAGLEGDALYARIYWNAAQTEFDNDLFNKSSADWWRMKKGFDDIIARYPDLWNLSNYAKFACLAGDRETTRALLERIGSAQEDWRAWQSLRPACAKWAYETDTERPVP